MRLIGLGVIVTLSLLGAFAAEPPAMMCGPPETITQVSWTR
jgi:hypothetical protein